MKHQYSFLYWRISDEKLSFYCYFVYGNMIHDVPLLKTLKKCIQKK